MKFNYILVFCYFSILFASCVGEPSNSSTSSNNDKEPAEEVKTTFLREPVDIVASTGEDYPQTLIDVDFPILPNAEVTSVGNTQIENGTVVMQMETTLNMNQIRKFYDKEMAKKGWTKKEMKIFQGADDAYSFRNDDYSARMLIIDDNIQDFRKLAITLNKRVNLKDY